MSPKSGGTKLAVVRSQSKWPRPPSRPPGRFHLAVVDAHRQAGSCCFAEPERSEAAYSRGDLPATLFEPEQRQRSVNGAGRADDQNGRGVGTTELPCTADAYALERRASRYEQQRAVIEKQFQCATVFGDLQGGRYLTERKVAGEELDCVADHRDQPAVAGAAGGTSISVAA